LADIYWAESLNPEIQGSSDPVYPGN